MSTFKTSDFIVDRLLDWWNGLSQQEQNHTQKLQMKVDNGSEGSCVRTHFLKRMVEFSEVGYFNSP